MKLGTPKAPAVRIQSIVARWNPLAPLTTV